MPQVRSKISSAAIWWWKDHSVHVLFLVLLFPEHMAAVILGDVLLQQFKALPGELVRPWVLCSISVLFCFALVSWLRVTQKNAFYWQHLSNICGFVQQVLWERVPKFVECVYFCKKMQQLICRAGSGCCQGDSVPLCLFLLSRVNRPRKPVCWMLGFEVLQLWKVQQCGFKEEKC